MIPPKDSDKRVRLDVLKDGMFWCTAESNTDDREFSMTTGGAKMEAPSTPCPVTAKTCSGEQCQLAPSARPTLPFRGRYRQVGGDGVAGERAGLNRWGCRAPTPPRR